LPGEIAKQPVKPVQVLRFKQWLDIWNDYEFGKAKHSRKPEPYIYMFSMRAAQLRGLCDVYRRTRDGDQVEGIQRVRDEGRTNQILRYVRYGYPFGNLNPAQRSLPDAESLRKPGWLPTAIVVNILIAGDKRRGRSVDQTGLVHIEEFGDGRFQLQLPGADELSKSQLAPLEVIDGQHRLWAFDDSEEGFQIPDDFELPVVAYQGLDIAWQAYLFWSINVSPKRINASHAFDLYPLLRSQDWLERAGDLSVYREARAQELVETLYAHPASPWKSRINMLGTKGEGAVSQAAFIRALVATVFATGRGGNNGLFQSNLEKTEEPLEWSRPQQAAFLIQLFSDIFSAVRKSAAKHWWIRAYEGDAENALYSSTSMLNQEMGVRAILNVANAIFYDSADSWRLTEWPEVDVNEDAPAFDQVSAALKALEGATFRPRLIELADALASFDWRALTGPGVSEDRDAQVQKRSYRGSGGYPALAADVMANIAGADSQVGRAAKDRVGIRG
jgi:DGQHR domain-containing protein